MCKRDHWSQTVLLRRRLRLAPLKPYLKRRRVTLAQKRILSIVSVRKRKDNDIEIGKTVGRGTRGGEDSSSNASADSTYMYLRMPEPLRGRSKEPLVKGMALDSGVALPLFS
jgi:hypothetical protein